MWKQSLLLFITFTTLLNSLDCNAYGSTPTGYCSAGVEVNCIENGTEWMIELIQYEGNYCDGIIETQETYPCSDVSDNEWCRRICGQDECTNDEIMTVEVATMDAHGQCVNFTEQYFIKDACIWGGWIGDNDTPETQLQGVILYCDEANNQITYDSWDNENCEGRPNTKVPELLFDLSTFSGELCIELICSDDVDVAFTSTMHSN